VLAHALAALTASVVVFDQAQQAPVPDAANDHANHMYADTVQYVNPVI